VNLFSHLRLGTIAIDFIVILLLYCEFLARSSWKDRHNSPVYNLMARLWWYPIVQCVSRVGAMAYNIALGWSEIFSFLYPAYADNLLLIWIGVILMPSAGAGMFIVFLKMQNGACAQLWRLLRCQRALTRADRDRLSSHKMRHSTLPGSSFQGDLPRASALGATRSSFQENPVQVLGGSSSSRLGNNLNPGAGRGSFFSSAPENVHDQPGSEAHQQQQQQHRELSGSAFACPPASEGRSGGGGAASAASAAPLAQPRNTSVTHNTYTNRFSLMDEEELFEDFLYQEEEREREAPAPAPAPAHTPPQRVQ